MARQVTGNDFSAAMDVLNKVRKTRILPEIYQPLQASTCLLYTSYASNVQKDYYRSLTYYFKGVEAARCCHYDRLYSILLFNIASIYYLKNDSTGLKYALECYELGHERKLSLIHICARSTDWRLFLNRAKGCLPIWCCYP